MNTDPIADLLTRIRNAYMSQKLTVDVPYSKMKESICAVLSQYEFIGAYSTEGEGVTKTLSIELAYDTDGKPRIQKISRVSKTSLRKYISAKEIEFVRGGYGISIISTSEGVMSGQEARKRGLGGEYIAKVW